MNRRHVLVVATQCKNMPNLSNLSAVAEELLGVLTDDAIGSLQSGSRDGVALLAGNLERSVIESEIRAAIAYAAEESATLVLALLGHGFTPGEDPTLYLMAGGSREGVRDEAINVPNLLIEAADRQSIAGVIALIDTCTAAAAQPSFTALSNGIRGGNTRVWVVMASAVGRSAYDFAMSRAVAQLLRTGVPGAALLLTPDIVVTELKRIVSGQDITGSLYDGGSPGEGLWLARNVRQAAPRALIGAVGEAALIRRVLSVISGGTLLEGQDLSSVAAALDRVPNSTSRAQAHAVLGNLSWAAKTTRFLQSWLSDALTAARLRRAAPIPLPSEWASNMLDEADVVSYLALNHPVVDADGRAQLVRFVLTLASDAGRSLDAPELRQWVTDLGATVLANDVAAALRMRQSSRRLRLIVSLHGAMAGNWPEELVVWLLCDDADYQHEVFACLPTHADTTAAVIEAVDWADQHAEMLDLQLRTVEIAVPAGLLLQWRPEEIERGVRLGLDFDVIMHWSERLNPSPHLRWINTRARRKLSDSAMVDQTCLVDWLGETDLYEIEELRARLVNDQYGGAVALHCQPRGGADVLGLLLSYTPIVLWPEGSTLASDLRRQLAEAWHGLPAGLSEAYRNRWRNHAPSDPLAELRAVWDDEAWLKFCRRMRPGVIIEKGTS
ncbi:hypothetical protein KBX53_00050 [Micromonospora sp. M51]|uniref:vWA-MoxR associated conflict system protein n=1 Tax=Micromonospora sp. M51 TaxID=2824889 RepID=UPI001B362545|nr:hypothetical protein [Micromonospora sp. M51]MBQ1009372.1 hypothetical protein [Micromonospora sp. M51]